MGDAGQIWFENVGNGTGTPELSIIGINNMLETESEDLNAEETIEPDPEIADGSVDELSMDEIEELLFGELQNCLALHTYKTIIRIIRKDMIS